MPGPKLECPECGAILKPSKPVAPGKKVKCPKCGEVFEARGGASEAIRASKKPAAKPAAKAVAPKKPAAPAKAAHDEDDDEGGVYGFIKEPEKDRDDDDEYDDKPDLSFALDESVKDPRGPAQIKVVRPSNFLILAGALQILGAILIMGWSGFPLIFSQEWVDPHEVVTNKRPVKEDEEPPPIERKELKPEQEEQLEALESAYLITHIIIMASCVPGLIIGGLIVVGGVKMQQLESYAWAMTASILAIIFGGLFGILFGIMALMCLMDKGVKEGFQYEKDHRHETY